MIHLIEHDWKDDDPIYDANHYITIMAANHYINPPNIANTASSHHAAIMLSKKLPLTDDTVHISIGQLLDIIYDIRHPHVQLVMIQCIEHVVSYRMQYDDTDILAVGIISLIRVCRESHPTIGLTAIGAVCSIAVKYGLCDAAVNSGCFVTIVHLHERIKHDDAVLFDLLSTISRLTSSMKEIVSIHAFKVFHILPLLVHALNSDLIDKYSAVHACDALGYMYCTKLLDVCRQLGIVPAVIRGLASSHRKTVLSCLSYLGKMCEGDYDECMEFADNGGIASVAYLLAKCNSRSVVARSLWVMSNFAAGSSELVGIILDYPNLMTTILRLSKSSESKILLEAIFVLSNMTLNANLQQFVDVIHAGLIESIGDVLMRHHKQPILDDESTALGVILELFYNLQDKCNSSELLRELLHTKIKHANIPKHLALVIEEYDDEDDIKIRAEYLIDEVWHHLN